MFKKIEFFVVFFFGEEREYMGPFRWERMETFNMTETTNLFKDTQGFHI